MKNILLFIFLSAVMGCSHNIQTVDAGFDSDRVDSDESETSDEDSDEDEVVKKWSGQLCVCDSECAAEGVMSGVCFFGICGVAATSSCLDEEACPENRVCKSLSFSPFSVCLFRWNSSNHEECEGVPDMDFSCINLYGSLPDGAACSEFSEQFSCEEGDVYENSSLEKAELLSGDTRSSRTVCADIEAWFKVVVPVGGYLEVGIEFFQPAGDIDLLLYNESGLLVESRSPAIVPYEAGFRFNETGQEYFGIYSKESEKVFYLQVRSYHGGENRYTLSTRHLAYRDGKNCLEAGFSTKECNEIMQFPLVDRDFDYPENNYRFELSTNHRFGTRRLIMATRYAIAETSKAFLETEPLWFHIISQKNGVTPAMDVGILSTFNLYNHVDGLAIDTAFYQKDGDNRFRNICRKDAPLPGPQSNYIVCLDEDINSHLVDIERQLHFIRKLRETDAISGLLLVDWLIEVLLEEQAEKQNILPQSDPFYISDEELEELQFYIRGDRTTFPFHNTHQHTGIKA